MGATQPIPRAAAQAVDNLLDDCAAVQRDQHVVILAAVDGLYGGTNVVDETAIAWIQQGVQARGAYATVMWVDLPVRRNVVWPDIPTRETVWRIPDPVKSVMHGADMLISHVLDFSTEEELKEWPELLAETKVAFVRNMATTAGLLSTAWARTPHALVRVALAYRGAHPCRCSLGVDQPQRDASGRYRRAGDVELGSLYGAARPQGFLSRGHLPCDQSRRHAGRARVRPDRCRHGLGILGSPQVSIVP